MNRLRRSLTSTRYRYIATLLVLLAGVSNVLQPTIGIAGTVDQLGIPGNLWGFAAVFVSVGGLIELASGRRYLPTGVLLVVAVYIGMAVASAMLGGTPGTPVWLFALLLFSMLFIDTHRLNGDG